MNFNEIFRKNDVTYDNIKSYKTAELRPLSRKHNFGKTTGGCQVDPPVFLKLK